MFTLSILTTLLLAVQATASPALPLNSSDHDSGNATNKSVTLIDEHEPGDVDAESVLPWPKIGCWEERVRPSEVAEARAELILWGEDHHIKPGGLHGQTSGISAVWVCNCKHFHHDHVVAKELDEAEHLIKNRCYHNGAGWVWIKKWQKSINFGSVKRLHYKNQDQTRCPKNCLWLPWEDDGNL